MLSLALAATLVGFGLLVVALMMANLPLAIACVAVCVVGLILLVVDTLRANKRGRGDEDDEPLFTIRGRESAAREAPLEDEQSGTTPAPVAGVVGGSAAEADRADTGEEQTPLREYGDSTASTWSLNDEENSGGLGSLVAPTSEHVVDSAPSSGSGGFSTLSGGFAAAPQSEGDSRGGDVNDYLRSTGSFPAQGSPEQDPAAQNPPMQGAEVSGSEADVPETEPAGTESDTAGSPPASATEPAPAAEQWAPTASAPESQPFEAAAPAAPKAAEPQVDDRPSESAPEPYVGRRRLAGDPTDNIIVRSANPDLPAMQFVWDDPDAAPKGDAPN